ncbi:MAG: hypothetical protein A2046_07220 [Bacteroidetes bacterium GWA2_30_7]|nr:MAG: hypothetical protein A2046_07220 [Bacteroidetes bacterium GWA2_30_7]
MKKYIIIILAVVSVKINAQQISTTTQFSENLYSINPAVAGNLPYNPVIMSFKEFWSGIDNAPQLNSLGAHTSFTDRVGVGGKAFSYSAGLTNKSGIEATYSYNLPISSTEDGPKIAFGLSAFLYQYKLNKDEIKMEDPNDNAIAFSSEKLIVPDASFGTYLYGKDYSVGVAVSQLFNRKVNMLNKDYLEQKQVRHYFLHGDYQYNISDNYSIKGSLLVKYIESGIIQSDITLKGIFYNTAWAGVSFRTSDAVSFLVGVSKSRFTLGYAYDYPISDLKKYSMGSHELMLIIILPSTGTKRNSFFKDTSTSSM